MPPFNLLMIETLRLCPKSRNARQFALDHTASDLGFLIALLSHDFVFLLFKGHYSAGGLSHRQPAKDECQSDRDQGEGDGGLVPDRVFRSGFGRVEDD